MNSLNKLKKIKTIICLDIGDGECSAFNIRKEGDKFLQDEGKLNLTKGSNEIPSIMYYDPQGNVIIGETTSEKGCVCVSNFKKSPPWENIVGWDGIEPKSRKRYRTLMLDFIRELWKNIIEFNSLEAGALKGKISEKDMTDVALFVGCPSSDNWLKDSQKKAYRDLICEATGIEIVFVIPESTASAFRAVMNNKSVCYGEGVAVFDFGSSTADFTYMCFDKRIIHSWTLGASAIEKIMYNLIYEDLGVDVSDLPYRYTAKHYQFEIRREAKEKYFKPYVKKNNEVKSEEKRTKLVEFGVRELKKYVTIDDAFMERVLTTPVPDPVCENGNPQKSKGKRSWREHCKNFFEECREMLRKDNLPVDRIVLAGSASKMYFVEDLCYEVFKIKPEPNSLPEYSVSGGLCQIAKNAYLVPKILEDELKRWETSESLKKIAEICIGARNRMEKLLTEKTEAFIEKKSRSLGSYTFGQWKYAVNEHLNSIDKKEYEKIAQESLKEVFEYLSRKYSMIGCRCAEALYSRADFSSNFIASDDENVMGYFSKGDSSKKYDFCQDFEIQSYQTVWNGITYFFNGLSIDDSSVNLSAYRHAKHEHPICFGSVVTEIMRDLKMPYAYSLVFAGWMDSLDSYFQDFIRKDTWGIISQIALLEGESINDSDVWENLLKQSSTDASSVNKIQVGFFDMLARFFFGPYF